MSDSVERIRDWGPGKPGIVKRWLAEINTAGKWQDEWERRCDKIIRRYEGEVAPGRSSSFNVLHSNTETLRPALYGQPPNPDVRRRVASPSPEDREAAELIERALRYMNDGEQFDSQAQRIVSDLLLCGRGTARVRYMPTYVQTREPVNTLIESDDEGAERRRFFTASQNEVDPDQVVTDDEGAAFVEIERLQFERADIEHVPYNDFRHTPAREWRDVRWVAFRHYFTREGLEQAFGKAVSGRTTMTHAATPHAQAVQDQQQPDVFQKCEVWEIWDKEAREVLFVSEGNSNEPLAVFQDGPDYYDLRGFFPCPEPLRSIITPGSLIPIPEFVIYQDLADELDEITSKIRGIVETIDVKGAYDGSMPELGSLFDSARRLWPVAGWRALTDKNGLQGVLDFIDIEPQVQAFVALTQQRGVLLDTIYQTVGISDIRRGQSDPRETASAQRLKGAFGQQRIAPRQRALQNYLRDLMRIQSELIAEKFEPESIFLITGIDPEPLLPILRVDALREFSIDVETDSTVLAEQSQVTGEIGQILDAIAAVGQAAQALPEGARLPLLQSVIRKFRMGRDVELALEQAAEQPPEPDPEAMEAMAKAENERAQIELKAVESERDFMIELEKLAQNAQKLGIDREKAEADVLMALAEVFERGDAA